MRVISGLKVFILVAGVSQTTACGDASGPKTGPPAQVVVLAGSSQPTPEVGTKLPLPLTIRVTDAQGQNVSGTNVLWNSTSGSLSAATSLTSVDGVASMEWTLGPSLGIQLATATVPGLPPVTFTEVAVPGPLTQIILTR